MCGLAGIALIGADEWTATHRESLRRVTDAVAHRGPESSRHVECGAVGLGFARLSLVGLESGDQPLSSPDGRLTLIANGEVYNHRELARDLGPGVRLASTSDCEVLLPLYERYGHRFLDRVRGILAVALWDRRERTLVLARDRFGVKPLFLHRDGDRIVLASEVTALLAAGVRTGVDWERALGDQLLTAAPRFSDEPVHSWFTGVRTVAPGTVLTIDLRDGSEREHRYWDFPAPDPEAGVPAAEFVRRYRATLRSAVTESATADVEVGLLLSGGIDSSAVAALAPGPLRTFGSLSTATVAGGDAAYARRVAAGLGLSHHQVVFDDSSVPTPQQWASFLWLLETPLAGPEAYYKFQMYRYVRGTAPSIKAMMIGGGSDEFNGGYAPSFAGATSWEQFLAGLRAMRRGEGLHRRPALADWWQDGGPPLLREAVLAPAARDGVPPDAQLYQEYLRWKYRDVQQYNCWHEDRTAAASGIEARVPFLDHRLVELVVGVPPAQRERLLWDKRILREAVAPILPAVIARREKVPFYYGAGEGHTHRMLARMLAQDDFALVEEALAGAGAAGRLDAAGLRALTARLAQEPHPAEVELALHVLNLGLLAGMVADPPRPLVERPVELRPVVADLTASDQDDAAIDDLLSWREPLFDKSVLALGTGVLVLRALDDDDWFVAVNGEIEYVVPAESRAWRGFLSAVDGERSLGELLVHGGWSREHLAEDLAEAVEEGVLVVVDGDRDA